MDNDNVTASGQPRRNLRSLTQYNPQSNVPSSQWVSYQHASVAEFFLDSALDGTFSMDSWGEIHGILAYQTVDHGTITPVDPTIFKTKTGTDPDEPGLIEALSSPQSKHWTKAMTEEIKNLLKQRTWYLIQKSEVPEESKIISGAWDFKCKLFPHGGFRKSKARYCVRGYIQKRLSDVPMNTYATVVQWFMLRLILSLTCIVVLKTQSTNFSNAFSLAELNQPVYLQPPDKYSNTSWGENPIIRLNKSYMVRLKKVYSGMRN